MIKWFKNLLRGLRFSKSASIIDSVESAESKRRASRLGIRSYPHCQFFPVKKIGESFIVFGDVFKKVSHNKAVRQFDGSVWIYCLESKKLSLR